MTKKEAFLQATAEYVSARATVLALYKELAAAKALLADAKEVERRAMYKYHSFVPITKATDEYIETLAKVGLK